MQALKLKDRRPETSVPEIRNDRSAVENFWFHNKTNKKPWKLAPLSPAEHGFINISERELVVLFFKNDLLKRVLLSLVRMDFPTATSHVDIDQWLRDKEPGYLIRRFLAHIGRDQQDPSTPMPKSKEERRRLKSHKGAVRLLSLEEIRQHVGFVRDYENLDLNTYQERGYVALGSIKTDGFKVQLLAYKLKELQCARYKRLPEHRLPPRITSTVAGVDYFLTEIRNTIRTGDDVTRIWDCNGDEIKILGIDLGQAFVVGVSAILPDQGDQEQQIFYNLAVSHKAVYQPTLKFRHWSEQQKRAIPPGREESLADVESSLPPLRGPDADFQQHARALGECGQQLDTFYNGSEQRYKRHKFDAKKARDEEFARITDGILRMVGGSIGERRDPGNKVAIGVGLGQFQSSSGLSSLHSSFLTYFLAKVRLYSRCAMTYETYLNIVADAFILVL